jgi:hypothetical protein
MRMPSERRAAGAGGTLLATAPVDYVRYRTDAHGATRSFLLVW